MVGLRIEDLSHAYGGLIVVDRVNLDVNEGEIVCLVGPSGCGKSTTLRLAAGLEPVQRGRVTIGDRVVATEAFSVAPEARRLGLVFQDYALFPHLTVFENVAFGLAALAPEAQRQRALSALEQVRMSTQSTLYPHELSGGQQQRIALARALAPRPSVMLLDEPFSNLDFQLRRQVWEDTLGVLRRAGTPTLLVTHDPHEAMKMGDRVAVMERGRITQFARPSDIYSRPASASIARFFGETTTLTGTVRGGQVATPFNAFPVDSYPDGTEVEIVIRPEALHLNLGHASHERCEFNTPTLDALVVEARHLGPYSLVHFRINDDTTVLVARVPGVVAPRVGAALRVHLDRTAAFVFPREEKLSA